MWNIFKKADKKKASNLMILSSSWKRKNFLDIFKIDAFILSSFIWLIVVAVFIQIEIGYNTIIIKDKENKLSIDYSKILEVKNTLWFLSWLKSQSFDWTNVVRILDYLEEIDLYTYKLAYNPTKRYFFVHIKSINQSKLDVVIDKWLKSWALNYFKTNQTLKIVEEWKVSISLIFN